MVGLKDRVIQRVFAKHEDIRSDENMAKLKDQLFEVEGIISQNLELILDRGKELNFINNEARILSQNSL